MVLALQAVDENKKHRVQRYTCSNPNCNRVFSKPKIIKYYVCPTCQTIVNATQTNGQAAKQEEPSPSKKLVKHKKPKAIEEHVKSEESKVKDLAISRPPAVMDECAQAATAITQKPENLEQAPTREPNVAEPSLNPQTTTRDETTFSSSSPGCKYGFAYLSQREKGTEIPETCVTCPKALDCMLSGYYHSGKTVKEIMKWYQP